MKKKEVSLFLSLIPVIYLISSLAYTIVILKESAHIPLISSVAVAAIVAIKNGSSWGDIKKGMVKGITLAMDAIVILMVIGIMIGLWIYGGVVPSMIYYGMQLLSPKFFLLATVIICSIVSLGTGSSWSTAGTVGVALVAIGKGLGIPIGYVAGAIVSGAYFGDKMSPLSDTTNLAPAVAGCDVFSHIRHMVYTTLPSYIISLVIFTIMGLSFNIHSVSSKVIDSILNGIGTSFHISPILLLAPIIVVLMVVLKIPPLPALFFGSILGALAALFFQNGSLGGAVSVATNGFVSKSGVLMVDELLSRGGLLSMMDTVALIICALSFGGVMESSNMLRTIANGILKRAKTASSLIATTIFTAIAMNIVSADQYMSIVIPGRMFKESFARLNLAPKNLSRALEDSATLSSPLIPWNSCGAFMSGTLGVSTIMFLPFAFFNLLNPLISLFYAFTGISIEKINKDKNK